MGASHSSPSAVGQRLLSAARTGDTPALAAAVDAARVAAHGASLRETRALECADRKGYTPLLWAATRGRATSVVLLLAAGADATAAAPDGRTPLHAAAAAGAVAVVEALLTAGANPFVEEASGATALDLAATLGVATAMARRALCEGTVAVQTRRALGLGSTFAPRWAVAAPRYPHAPPGAPTPALVRRTLALYAPGGVEAVCKAWLDGARRPRADARGRVSLELHPTHARPPGDAAWKRLGAGRGYAVAVRPVDGSPAAAAALAALVAAVAGDPAPPLPPIDDAGVARRLQAPCDASPPRVCPTPAAGRPPSAASAPVLPLLSSPGDGTSWGRGPSPERGRVAAAAVAAAVAAAALPAPAAPRSPSNARDDDCVVCMAAPAGAGFVHGDSMHVCCCAGCAQAVERAAAASGARAECPMCRAPVERVVMHVFS